MLQNEILFCAKCRSLLCSLLFCCRFTRVEFTLQVRIIHLIYDRYDQFLKNVQLLFICNKLINSLSCFLQFSMLKLRLTVK